MKLIKSSETSRYTAADELQVDVTKVNNGLMFKIERFFGVGSTEQLNLNEQKLKALIDLYYEVRPDQAPITHTTPAEVCEHDWGSSRVFTFLQCDKCGKVAGLDTICKKCEKERG